MNDVANQSPIERLQSLTEARIFLPSSGGSISTAEVLAFQMAHAHARDAVYSKCDFAEIAKSIEVELNVNAIEVCSSAADRENYLKRPDLGRKLSDHSVDVVKQRGNAKTKIALVAADGLSAEAINCNFLPFLREFLPLAQGQDWEIPQVFLATQSRVALGDHIAELLESEMVVMCIGERPGLSSTSSMGIYFTYNPHQGCTDESRNCISNIRTGGLSSADAAQKLHYLLSEAFRRKLSGITLKDDFKSDLIPHFDPESSQR